ncbi:MAG TPA: hypothetical protein ENI39_03535, partial [Anaerolineae bacterium]|nr:hypothetical protein [Anaerolineae bacterium]
PFPLLSPSRAPTGARSRTAPTTGAQDGHPTGTRTPTGGPTTPASLTRHSPGSVRLKENP